MKVFFILNREVITIYQLGGIVFIISTIVMFGSDKFYKAGKIKNLKNLLIIKVSALLVSIVAVLLMFFGNK
ncbi:MAG: hypothetical protein FH753_00775 [Firmicutes bacterium]|nr:hypothetical protein [Bacillota bacterium]